MFRFEHSEESSASPSAIYAFYSDVTTWPRWDHEISAMTIDGAFAAGSTGTLRLSSDGCVFPFTIVAATADEGFADETPIPGGVIRFEHALTPLANGGTCITHRLIVEGQGADEIGAAISAGMPETVATLAKLAASAPISA